MVTAYADKAPFPYFGGKSAVADIVWNALGDVKHYIEPFFGSGAVLLNRPEYHGNQMETVCDKDGFISNVWRSIHLSPDETAKWCDWPVNHADLSARKRKLIANEEYLLENLIIDDEWHDPKLAGYWIWAASCWIGSGLTRLGQIPHVGDGGMGVHAIGQIPHVGDGGADLSEPYNTNIYKWFRALSERLRYVRVVCGDWTRVCGGKWQEKCGTCGIFFDPPYSDKAERKSDLYNEDDLDVAHKVRDWCIERGGNKTYRIVLAGYFEEHEELLNYGWTYHSWKAHGGYANIGNGDTAGKENKHKETLFFSPHCISSTDNTLFEFQEFNEEIEELVS